MTYIADLDDNSKFINWGQEPPRHLGDFENGYMPRSVPEHHWCLLGEIVGKTSSDNNTHTLELRDKTGHVQTAPLFTYKRKPTGRAYKIGHTVAILYPERFDHLAGVSEHDHHYSQSPQVEIFPFTLAEILEAGRKSVVHTATPPLHNMCQVCRMPRAQLTMCGWCHMVWWCKMGPCRSMDRKNGHREQCKVLRGMREFLTRDWDAFRGFWKGRFVTDSAEHAEPPRAQPSSPADDTPDDSCLDDDYEMDPYIADAMPHEIV